MAGINARHFSEVDRMNENMARVMRECGNYFAVLCEHVSVVHVGGDAVRGSFAGKYAPGMLLRVHGSFSGGWADFGEGEVYEVVSCTDGTLTMDRKLHTIAPYLFIAYLEPPSEFVELCADIEAYESKNAGRAGLASESIDGYSWSAATDTAGRSGYAAAFSDRLKPYRCPKPTTLYYARNALPWGV